DRAVALPGRDDPLTLGLQLHRGLARDLERRRTGDRVEDGAALHDDPPRLDGEVSPALAGDGVAQQELEGGVRRLEGVPARLQLLDPLDQLAGLLAGELV